MDVGKSVERDFGNARRKVGRVQVQDLKILDLQEWKVLPGQFEF